MRGAIASVELFAVRVGEPVRRLTLTLGAPQRTHPDAEPASRWACRVALADRHRPRIVEAPDSVTALAAALALGREWIAALSDEGFALWRDREATRPFEL